MSKEFKKLNDIASILLVQDNIKVKTIENMDTLSNNISSVSTKVNESIEAQNKILEAINNIDLSDLNSLENLTKSFQDYEINSKPIEIKPQQSSKSKSANNKRNSSITQEKKYKKPISGSGKEKATDIPSWAKGERPIEGESGKDFARRLMDAKYGEGNYNTRETGDEFNQLKKYGDRGFE